MKRHLAILLLFAAILRSQAQGFINLDFESAVITTNGSPPFNLIASDAIPGWTAYFNGVPTTYIVYNGSTLGSEMVALDGTNNSSGFPAIQGKYFIYLKGSSEGFPHSAAIGQTGMIPLSAMSLLFLGQAGPSATSFVSFNGQVLPLNAIGNTPNYNIYAADVSGYAGQTGELLFIGLGGSAINPNSIGGFIIDNIQFSTVAVPEPGTFALAALGTLLLGCRRWKK